MLEHISVLAEEVLPVGGGYRFTFSGESEDFFESSNTLFFAYFLIPSKLGCLKLVDTFRTKTRSRRAQCVLGRDQGESRSD